jgi:hypothetical protein
VGGVLCAAAVEPGDKSAWRGLLLLLLLVLLLLLLLHSCCQ